MRQLTHTGGSPRGAPCEERLGRDASRRSSKAESFATICASLCSTPPRIGSCCAAAKAMLAELRAVLDRRGFRVNAQAGELGHYVVEKAFAEK